LMEQITFQAVKAHCLKTCVTLLTLPAAL